MQMQEKKVKGFSLLELLVVVVIIGALAGVGFQPFQKWRKDRLVRTQALQVSSVIQDIYSQVQRGHYGFVQFVVENDKIYSNGMKMDNFTELVRKRYTEDGAETNFYNSETRCSDELIWDDEGETSNKLTVNSIEISDKIKLSYPTSSGDDPSISTQFSSTDVGMVCFSKDGSYYSGDTLMRVSSGGDTNVRDEIIVSDEDGDNYFSIKWSRFGNIMLSKWTNGSWYIQ